MNNYIYLSTYLSIYLSETWFYISLHHEWEVQISLFFTFQHSSRPAVLEQEEHFLFTLGDLIKK